MMSFTANSLKQQRSHKSSSQKYFDNGSIGKENIEKVNSMAALIVAGKVVSPQPNCRGRKNSDNSYDRPLRPKGLQEFDVPNNQPFIAKRRNHSTSDATGNKPFARTLFPIYNDSQKEENERAEKPPSIKPIGFERTSKKCLRDRAKSNSLSLQKNEEVSAKISSKTVNYEKTIASPKDLPEIPVPNVLNIKANHKRAHIKRKTPKAVYDILSVELAYNIGYMNEYVKFQMEINVKKKLSPTFLSKGVTADQRRLIVKYLIDSTTHYKYPSFILYQTVKIFDFYIDAVDVKLQELQMVALASLWIALKKDLINDNIPEASTIIELAGAAFQGDKRPLITCEKKILMALKFEISFAEPFSMLALYTVMIEKVRELDPIDVQKLYYCGSYLIDLSLLHDRMLNISAVHLAVVSAEIALVLIMTSNENLKSPQWNYWQNQIYASNPAIEKYRLSNEEMNSYRTLLLQKVILSKERITDFYAVFKKYNTKRYGSVSHFIVSKISTILLERLMSPVTF